MIQIQRANPSQLAQFCTKSPRYRFKFVNLRRSNLNLLKKMVRASVQYRPKKSRRCEVAKVEHRHGKSALDRERHENGRVHWRSRSACERMVVLRPQAPSLRRATDRHLLVPFDPTGCAHSKLESWNQPPPPPTPRPAGRPRSKLVSPKDQPPLASCQALMRPARFRTPWSS